MTTLKKGKKCKVTLGANSILGMGVWSMPGVSSDELDATEFGGYYRRLMV